MLFRLRPDGFTAWDLRQHVAPLLGLAPEALSAGQRRCAPITIPDRRVHDGPI